MVLFLLGLVATQLLQEGDEGLQNADSYASISAAVIAALALLLQAWTGLRPTKINTRREEEISDAASDLAQAVRKRSREEEHRQQVHDPVPLPVRWHNAAETLIDRWENILAVRVGKHSEPLRLDNTVDDIAATFRQIPSRRLVVLGKAGSGKTVLAHHLIHQLLERREDTDPVPVLFSLNTWDVTTPLRDWLVAQLRRDYDLDGTDSTGRTLAQALVDNDRILPVLDGFDEITAERRATAEKHRTALSMLNKTDLPMVLTSRPDEYRDAVTGDHFLAKAAAIELDDLTLDDFAGYLTRTTRKNPNGDGTTWDPVLRHLREQPHETASAQLRQVLTTPLMVFLARTIYSAPSQQNPNDLLDTTEFPTPQHIENHLLDAFIPALYGDDHGRDTTRRSSRWGPDQAQRWLGHLADHLTHLDTHDLAWWQLATTLRWYTRILATAITIALTYWLMVGLASELAAGLAPGFMAEIKDTLPNGRAPGRSRLVLGLAAGLVAGLINEVRFRRRGTAREPERLRLHLRSVTRTGRLPNMRRLATEFTTGLALALGVGLGIVLALGTGLVFTFAGGLAFAVGIGIVLGIPAGVLNVVTAMLGDSHVSREAIAPWKFLSTDRTVALLRTTTLGLVVGAPIGLVTGLVIGLLPGFRQELAGEITFGIVCGLVYGLPFALARLAWSAWGNWLLFARLWLPLTRCLPWRPKRFLEDAYNQGVLRQAGAVYQFRHVQLRDHLTSHYRNQSRPASPAAPSENDDPDPVPEPR